MKYLFFYKFELPQSDKTSNIGYSKNTNKSPPLLQSNLPQPSFIDSTRKSYSTKANDSATQSLEQ